jgi:hypothetical protein
MDKPLDKKVRYGTEFENEDLKNYIDELWQYTDFLEERQMEKLNLYGVVQSKRDETLELLEEIIIKVKEADSELENGIYDPMLECAKHILNNYEIKRR